MSKHAGNAVVIGGGLAGLVVARVLSDHFGEVTLVERDRYPAEPELRGGVPQGFQIHVLLAQGRALMNGLFPALDGALAALGAPEHDVLEHWRVRFAAGPLARCVAGVRVRGVSRVRLEHEVRRLVAAIPNVRLVENAEVTGLLVEGGRVSGVSLRPRREGQGQVPAAIAGALVVDASGRGSKAPDWLQALGFPAPATTIVDGHLSYATRWYQGVKLPDDAPGGVLVGSHAPAIPRCGAAVRVEGDRYMVLLANIGAELAPTDDAGYLDFARTLTTDVLYQAIRDARPLGPARAYRRTENQWRAYHRVDRLPEGFVPMGDALCSFNPFYGQGMTVATIEAMALGEEVRRGLEGLARRAQRRFAPIVGAAWQMATSEDYRWPTTEGGLVTRRDRFAAAYVDQVVEAAVRDPRVATTFIKVIHMQLPASALFRPHVLFPVVGRVLSGKKATQSRGARAATA
jgi:2-polyprenyl-6-methoxyphenol hydroxylase-like FAD-dependent oxidoreductase